MSNKACASHFRLVKLKGGVQDDLGEVIEPSHWILDRLYPKIGDASDGKMCISRDSS